MTHQEAMLLHEARMDASRLRTGLKLARDILVQGLGEGDVMIRDIDKRLGDLEALRAKGEWPYPGMQHVTWACYAKGADGPPAQLTLCNETDPGAFKVFREKEPT